MKRSVGECAHCGRQVALEARGLCIACYTHQRRYGRLEGFKPYHAHHKTVGDYLSARQLFNIRVVVDDLGYGEQPLSLARLLRNEALRIERLVRQSGGV